MKTGLKFLPVFILCLGLIAGCSSSSNSPAESLADANIAETGSADSGNTETGSTETGSADADGGVIDLNGDYDVTVSLSEAAMAVPECESVVGMLNVTGTTITGSVDDRFIISGSIAADGTITGGFAFEGDATPFATYDGMLDGEDLVGEWADVTGCAGTWRAVKVIPE